MKTFSTFITGRKLASVFAFSTLLLTSTSVFAQLPAEAQRAATQQADPGRVGSQISNTEIVEGDFTPNVQVRNLVLQKAPPNAENIKLTLRGISFDGLGVYSTEEIRSVYADKLGQQITLADVYGISSALTNKYRNDGYILTQVVVPPQTIENGIVTLRAVEGFVDQIVVEGAGEQESALKTIRGYADNIRTAGTLNVRDLEKFLLLINDLPGVEARSVLSPSRTQTGASDLRIIVERDPYDAFVGVNNHGSRFIGPLQVSLGGTANSFFGMNESITAQFITAPDRNDDVEMSFYSLGYKQPIGTLGTTIEGYVSHSNTEPGFTLERFDVQGRSDYLSVKVEHPIIRTRTENLYVHGLVDARNVHSSNNLEENREDRLRAVRFGGRYQFLDTLFNVGINTIRAEIAQGVDVFGTSSKNDIRTSRPSADPTFLKANAEIERLQRLTSDVNVLVQGRGQLSNNALFSSEEFGVGGFNLGRGYDPSEIVGDDGIAGKLEVQWNKPYDTNFFEDYQLYSFYDIGRVWNKDATTNDGKKQSIASAGLGIRAEFVNDLNTGFAIAFPLTRDLDTTNDKDPRFYFNVNKNF